MSGTILSILMLVGMALTVGGIYLLAKKRDIKRGILMIVAAIVMFGNVAISTMPPPKAVSAPGTSGTAHADKQP